MTKPCTPPHSCPDFTETVLEVTADSRLDQLAARAYHAFRESMRDYTTALFSGSNHMPFETLMPVWEDLIEQIRHSWRLAVVQVEADLHREDTEYPGPIQEQLDRQQARLLGEPF